MARGISVTQEKILREKSDFLKIQCQFSKEMSEMIRIYLNEAFFTIKNKAGKSA